MADPAGISVATDTVWTANPTWVRLDTDYRVQSWSVDRGRQTEMTVTGTGTARVELVDPDGDFDPTNPGAAFHNLKPLAHAAVCLQNPFTDVWRTLFRGYISQIVWRPFQTLEIANVTLELVDALALFAACEMKPGFGNDYVNGNIVFNEDDDLAAAQTRINFVLDKLGWPSSLRSVFTGNVRLQQTVYAPRSTALQVMQDVADAEFPDIANIYIGGPRQPGAVVFHGRLARFNPTDPSYELNTWPVGDDTAAAADPAYTVRISPPLQASLDDTLLYTSALATPQGIDDGDISAQYVEDTAASAAIGLRSWSAENLATLGGLTTSTGFPTTALEETKLFADYMRDNYTSARVRVGEITIKSRPIETTWNLLCNIDISDLVHLKTTHGGGGGFDTDFHVEGLHYTARPGGGIPIVELVMDVSPHGYYDHNPFT